MNQKDYIEIEQALLLSLPKSYKLIMKDYPFEGYVFLPHIYDELWNDSSTIIEMNKELRESGFFETGEWEDSWLAFGHDGFGNYWYLDLSEKESKVYLADHEGSMKEIAAHSFQDWVKNQKIQYDEWEAELKVKNDRKKSKKWWQFWL